MTAGTSPLIRDSSRLERRPWRNLGMRDAVVLTAPLVLVLLYLVFASTVDYYRASQFDDYFANSISVEGRFQTRLRQLLRLPWAMVARQKLTPEARDAGIVNLQVEPTALDDMYDDPQLGWGSWTDAVLDQRGTLLDVKIRKRGDNSIHWLTDKRTLSVRTPRTAFFKRYRAFGLSTKTVLTSYVANRMAREYDLLSPTTTVLPVFLNNQYSGMYRFLEVVDESFLRPFNRMPGNVFRGDAAERGDYFKGVPRDLFANPYIWDRVAANDRPTSAGPGQLRLFIEDINGTDFEAHQRLMRRVDPDEIARLVAYLLATGDPYHMDAIHNQLWYEDPSTSLLHPIPWDIRLLRLADRPPQRVSAFFRAALRDPWLVDAIMARVARDVRSGAVVSTGDSLARDIWSRYHAGFTYDSLRLGMVSPLGYPSETHRVLTENRETLTQWVNDAQLVTAFGPMPGGGVMDLETRGFAGVDLLALENNSGAITGVRMDRNRNGTLDAEDPALPGRWDAGTRQYMLSQPLPLLSAWRTHLPGIRPGTQHYRLFLTGSGVADAQPILRNRYTDSVVTAGPWERSAPIAAPTSFSPWEYPVIQGRLHRLSGTVRLSEDLRIGATDTLIIEAGTRILLDPDVSIVSRGRVVAEGTPARPILFTRADSVRPWGAFSLLGAGADSSLFRHVTWEWGGGDLVDRIEYIGMVNLHRVSGVVIEHATFRDNVRSDDTFHGLHSDVVLRRSEFVRANSDALDLDVSSGLLEDNTFLDSGGDAIDLMASTPMIRGNRIYRSRDKGISVGEASSPVIYGNYIEGCRRGIEIKDRSDPVALDNTLVGNGAGIYSDRKNWRYGGGGFGTFVNNTLRDNRVPLQLDQYSRITLANVSGLDSAMNRISPAAVSGTTTTNDLRGLYRSHGIAMAESPSGSAPAGLVDPVPPIVSVRFEEDFVSIDDGWRWSGGVGRVEKSDRTLHATAENRSGAIGKPVEIDLRASGPATLVLEVAAVDMDSATLTLVSPEGNVSRPLLLSGHPSVFRLVTMELPARHYTAMVIAMTPRPRIEKLVRAPGWTELKPGQFWLRGYDVYPNPPADRSLPPGS